MTESAIATVIVVCLVAYAAWATFRLSALGDEVRIMKELLRLYRNENERVWRYWPGMTAEDVHEQIDKVGGSDE